MNPHLQEQAVLQVHASEAMSPGMDNEGFPVEVQMTDVLDSESGSSDGVSHVTVVGAGPAGLMLA